MANELRFSGNIQVLQDVGAEASPIEDQSYTNLAHDLNAGGRSWGGKFNLPAYNDADVCYWENVVPSHINSTGADITDDAWCEGSKEAGTYPTNAYVVAVEYVSALGSPGDVYVEIDGTVFAQLGVGEGCVIPIYAGTALTGIKIWNPGYDDDTDEATINVMVAGT